MTGGHTVGFQAKFYIYKQNFTLLLHQLRNHSCIFFTTCSAHDVYPFSIFISVAKQHEIINAEVM